MNREHDNSWRDCDIESRECGTSWKERDGEKEIFFPPCDVKSLNSKGLTRKAFALNICSQALETKLNVLKRYLECGRTCLL